MKKILSMLVPLVLAISMAGCSDSNEESSKSDVTSKADTSSNADENSTADESESPAEAVKGFSVDGTKLLDANGNEFVMRGINHAYTWYKTETASFDAIADTGSNTIRVVLSDGEQWDKDGMEAINEIIEICKEKEMIAVLEVHDATGSDEETSLQNATDYWLEMKDALIGNEEYVILNIANEWVGSWNSTLWRDGYVTAIPQLRDAGIKNTILVDSAGWGQYGKSIADYGKEVLESDPEQNTMFAIHMYGTAGKNETTIKNNIDNVINQDLCLIIGEFGYNHSDGDVDEEYIMKYCTEKNVGYLGWSWSGNGEGVEYLDIVEDFDPTKLSADWGENLVNGENGIKATSKKCSIFE